MISAIPNSKSFEVSITGGQETHPTAGYRRWRGRAAADIPMVGFAATENSEGLSWVRSSAREESVELGILFSPHDDTGRNISISFSVGDSVVCAQAHVPSQQTEPNPLPGIYRTGRVIALARLLTQQPTTLYLLLLAVSDVRVGRKGIWHLKPQLVGDLVEPWRKIMTFGRTGNVDKGASRS